jgi:DNA-binding MarR family transcriptional regulator
MSDVAPPPPPLIGALMRVPLEHAYERVIAALHAEGFTDVVPAHLAVLRYPGPSGRRPVQLAADANLTRQAMNYLLGQLESLGYIERRPDEDDRRGSRVHATERGEQLITVGRAAVRALEDEWAGALGPQDLETLRDILTRLNGHVAATRGGVAIRSGAAT